MPDTASIENRAISRSATRIRKSVRPAVINTLLSLLTLFVSTAEAGNVQFSSTTPAVVDNSAAANAEQSGPQPVIRRGREPSKPKLLRAGPTDSVQEFAPQPNSIRAVMLPVTEAEAMAHDSQVARDLPAGINLGGTIETLAKLDTKRTHSAADDVRLQKFEPPKQGLLRSGGVTGANGIVSNDAPPGPASIEELARALRYHPDLIYQYVRNNIEIDPVRGIHKGALGALLDNQGSAFDQAQLMVSLLRTSGYDARFVRGVIKLSAQQFTDWYGLPTTNVCAVLNLMGETQIPVYSINAPQAGTCPSLNAPMTDISIEHVWVKANIGGTWYTFDPSYKPHSVKSAVDLNVASGYNAAAFLKNATSGATVTPDLVRGLNRAGIRTDLQTASTNLATWIRKNKPTATISDIIGGKSITPFYAGTLRQTQNPLLDASWNTQEWVDIPVGFKPTVRVVYQGIDQTFTSDAIYGKRLTITYNASNQPVLKLEGQAVGAPGNPVAPGADSVISFVVWHNGYVNGNADHAFDQHIKGGGTYLVVNGWGPTGRGLSQNYLKNLEDLRAAGNAETSEAVLGASLGVLGAQWVSQTTNSASITDRLANAYTIQHHQVGIAGYEQGPYVDLPSNISSTVQMAGDWTLEKAVFQSNGMHLSILESTAVNQTSGVSAVSTVKLLDLAMSQGLTIYNTGGGRYTNVIQPALVNCQAHLTNFQNYLKQGYQLLIPGNCQLAENTWKGVGYFVLGTADTLLLGSTISGGLSGGFYTKPVPAAANNVSTINNSQSQQKQTNVPASSESLTKDPIDMVHGNFLYEHQDIKTGYGDWPDSLKFQRLYSSGMKTQSGALGKGWSHNYDIRFRTASDGFIGMGDRLAIDAVGTIIEHKAALDLLNDRTAPAEKFLSAVIAQRWFGDQLVDNTRIVTLGLNSDVFARLPDGSFSAPPGKAVRLDVSGTTAQYVTLAGTSYYFNGDKVAYYLHSDNRLVNFTWSGDLLTRVDNSSGRSLTFAYANNRLQSVSSPQQTVRYTYDSKDNLISEADPDGFTTRFEYDLPGRMTKFFQPTFPNTAVATNAYDTLGRVQTQVSAAGNLSNYYFAGYRSEEVGPGGSTRTNYVDSEGNLLQVSDPVGNWTTKEYDGQSRLVRETRPEGNRTEYTYDDATCVSSTSQLKGCTHNVLTISRFPKSGSGDSVLTQRFTYDPMFGNVKTVTDAKGQRSEFSYLRWLPTYVTRSLTGAPADPATSFFYESVLSTAKGGPAYLRPIRSVEKIDSTRTSTTTTSYAADYTPATMVKDADGLATKTVMTFDNEGRLLTSKRDGVATVTNTYDKRGNVIRSNANLLGADEVIGYDADSREISRGVAVIGGAMVTCKRYNAMGDVTRVWGPGKTAGVSTCPVELAPTPYNDTTYDDHHRPSLVVRFIDASDGGNRVTKMEYNADDSVKSIRKAVGTGLEQSYVSYVYNPNGTIGLTTDAKGNTTVNLYDGHDRLYRTHYPLNGQPGMGDGNNYEQYTWDANSNLIALRKRDGQTITQSFDSLDRLVTRTFPSGVGNVQFSYDLRGLKTASQYGDGSHTVTNSYDGLGQLTQTSAAGRTLRYSHDTAGNLTDIVWPDGFHVATTYDSYRRPTQMLENGTQSLAKYTYDTLNRRTLVELGNGTRTEAVYDGSGWLVNLNHRFTSSTEDWLGSFTRNQLGEIKQASVTNNRYGWTPVAASTAYASNALNQYTSAAGTAVTYDGNGNLTGDGSWTYSYDPDNRMKTASRSGTSATLGYDPEGRLVRTTVNGTDTNLMYDGQNLAGEYNSAGQLTRSYVFGPGVDAPLVQYEGVGTTAKSWLYANQQGSIVALANVTGATTSSQAYGPFGETQGTPTSRFGYTGQQYLAPLGLYYYKARMYSPALGRFLQTDPVGYKADLNWYAYVGNNPINLTDPTGLTPCSDKALKEQQEEHALLAKERAALGQSTIASMAEDGKIGVPGPGGGALGLGSTGRTVANSLNEQLAMKQAISDPGKGSVVPLKSGMTDARWPGSEGWVKMTQMVNGIEVHYVRNVTTGAVDDFKFTK
ncbi:RHS repeat-associated core domain-containing protein [Caballeronia sp. dw_19]|uniref:RHS repeat-associated core domain-containing protein n=1 Tax=Caballeronia sp. dw_19 TaxID=2719791 RepID=UPI001BD58CB4|nr:RHS repeat-associated core domain-containing protein [Caballeronia sp. dw_19]